jgi:hypothetical protein
MSVLVVKYSCPLCRIKDREVEVRARESEDVIQWLEGTCFPAIGADHMTSFPACGATSLTDLKIPISGSDKVGGVIKQ